jgi:uncharacterized protein
VSEEGPAGFLPGRVPIDAYGKGGFRFGEMSHRGSILCLPSGVYAWSAKTPADLDEMAFVQVLAEARGIDVLIIGTGERLVPLSEPLRWALRGRGIGVDVMATGAAVRTYNIVLAEQRLFAAALLAID